MLRVVNGSKIYGDIHAIDGINFELCSGEAHALVGENGAGKSTLCKAIAGAIKLTSGEIFVGGKSTHFDGPRTRSPPVSAWSTKKQVWCRP